jgi:hypothetical protein
MVVARWPAEVLFVHFKRFQDSGEEKVETEVRYPIDELVLDGIDREPRRTYDLVGMI